MPPHLGAVLSEIDRANGLSWSESSGSEALACLAERTRVDSIIASNAIAEVSVPQRRAKQLIHDGGPNPRTRQERELVGYRDALDSFFGEEFLEPPSANLLCEMHERIFDVDVGAAADSPGRAALDELLGAHAEAVDSASAHPLLLISALTYGVIALRPFERGNARMSRLLRQREQLRLGYLVARYQSVDALLEERTDAYLEALGPAQAGRVGAEMELWPWADLSLTVLAAACRQLQARLSTTTRPPGVGKQSWVEHWILESAPRAFSVQDIRETHFGTSEKTIRNALRALRQQGLIECRGSGPASNWRKRGEGADAQVSR